MVNCKPAATPMTIGTKLGKKDQGSSVDPTLYKKLVGSLMNLTTSRSDIMLSRIFHEHPLASWKKDLKIYCWNNKFGILYTSISDFKLSGYSNSNFASSIGDRKSTSGYVFSFGSGAVAWASKKQPIVTLSSAEAENVAMIVAACQTVWMRRSCYMNKKNRLGFIVITNPPLH
ncbi:secreted RxLR effector protein 161-like [Cryptomeria japonica]|uniref:secreted RxLR effector protein 161-like n=1 Tax=Cryptomeria japonica TaxID=3369 RepID=UPI0027DA4322|nr:secreted RxLR effector protein 161-like [Cryptomeria japonica]